LRRLENLVASIKHGAEPKPKTLETNFDIKMLEMTLPLQ